MGGTPELFHAGLALIMLGAIGWFLRQGPLSAPPATPVPAPVQSTQQPIASVERPHPVYASATKVKPAKIKPTAVKRVAIKPTRVKPTKVKASTAKRRQKKASKRSQHVQR